jgi:hypothetical protein
LMENSKLADELAQAIFARVQVAGGSVLGGSDAAIEE